MLKQLTKEEYARRAARSGRVAVFREFLADRETPVAALSRLGEEEECFLLESVAGGDVLYIGVGESAWPSMGRATATKYQIRFVSADSAESVSELIAAIGLALTAVVALVKVKTGKRFTAVSDSVKNLPRQLDRM